jgi:hypothetical protein
MPNPVGTGDAAEMTSTFWAGVGATADFGTATGAEAYWPSLAKTISTLLIKMKHNFTVDNWLTTVVIVICIICTFLNKQVFHYEAIQNSGKCTAYRRDENC